MKQQCSVRILTCHLHVRPPLDDCSHPVPHHTLVEAGVAPLQRRDGQPRNTQGVRRAGGA